MHRRGGVGVAPGCNRIAQRFVNADGQHEGWLAHRLAAPHVVFAIGLGPQIHLEVRRDVASGRDLVGTGRVGGKVPLVVPHQLLGGQPAHALHKSAFDLTDVDGGVDAVSHVVEDVDFQHAAFAGQGVDGHFGARSAIAEVVERPTGEGGLVVVNLGGAVKTVAPQLDAIGVSRLHHRRKVAHGFGRDHLAPFKPHRTRAAAVQATHKRCKVVADVASGKLCGSAVEVGAAAGGGGTGIGHFAGIAGGDQYAGHRHAQFVRHDLRHLGVQSLAHFGTTVIDLHAAVGVHVDQRTGLVEQRRGKADAEFDRRDGHAALEHRALRVPGCYLCLAFPIARCLLQLWEQIVQDVVFHRHLVVGDVAAFLCIAAVQVGHAHVQRIAAQRPGNVAQNCLDHDHPLRAAKAPKRRMALGVGLAAVRRNVDIAQVVSVVDVEHGAVGHRA